MAGMLRASRLRPALSASLAAASVAGGGLLASHGSRREVEPLSPGEGRQLLHLAPPLRHSPAGCQEVKCDSKLKRTTSKREFNYVYEEDFTPAMKEIAGSIDFRGIIEEGCFLLEGVGDNAVEQMVAQAGLKVFAKKHTVLIEEGSPNDAIFVVGAGMLGIYVGGVQVGAVGPGQVIGLYTMLKGTVENVPESVASADVRVVSDTAYVLQLRHHHFMNVLDMDGKKDEVLARMRIMMKQREMQNKAAVMLSNSKPVFSRADRSANYCGVCKRSCACHLPPSP